MGGGLPDWRIDYCDAHQRHWEDAEFLFEHKRLANADHLYGLSAECALKAIMVQMGLTPDPLGDLPERTYRVHINELWGRFLAWVQGRPFDRYAASLPQSNPFHDWSVAQRYANRAEYQEDSVENHRRAASSVKAAMARAKQDGIVI